MNNLGKYNKAFIDIFEVEEKDLKELKYQSNKKWDSVGHMALISELEDAFDIMFEMEDIIDFSSYEKGMEILKKMQVDLDA